MTPEDVLALGIRKVEEATPGKYTGPWAEIGVDDVHLGMAVQLFGLPDGSRPPPGFTIRPGAQSLIDAVRRAVIPLLPPGDTRLPGVPIGVARIRDVHGRWFSVTNNPDLQAIAVSGGFFAGLYSANDRFAQAADADRGEPAEEDLTTIAEAFPRRLARFLWGRESPTGPRDDSWMFTQRVRTSGALRSWVGLTTTLQQLFLLLHEYGHAADPSLRGHARPAGAGLLVHGAAGESTSTAVEDFADAWAAERLATALRDRRLPRAVVEEPSFLVSALFTLFEYVHLLNAMQVIPVSGAHRAPRDRFRAVTDVVGRDVRGRLSGILTHYREDLFDQFAELAELQGWGSG